MPDKKPRKSPVRTPASHLMKTLAAAERLYKRLPPDQQARFLRMFTALIEEAPLFREEAKP